MQRHAKERVEYTKGLDWLVTIDVLQLSLTLVKNVLVQKSALRDGARLRRVVKK